ncbi:3-deoxy-D-manno-octulosonic acid kinase [Dongshaea marina]|uniref:3-deoxy-D-manno-octulosonic acid kinase n=1 Tax=Dongshaea marina TaxID=2047966 RepID=UPI000D3E938C|nr:3-deoxy-D-manno-octulosonic acid kinase [Dongshaea marina]
MITVVHDKRHTLFFDPEVLDSVRSEMFSPEYWQQQDAVLGSSTGRGTAWFVKRPTGPLVLRHYYRGGMIGRVLRDQFPMFGLKRSRSWREFELLQKLHQAGLPVPKPVAGQMVRKGAYCSCDILIELLQETRDLVAALQDGPLDETAWKQVGAMIRRFHDQQVYHADLNAHNILQGEDGQLWLIDFDKGAIRHPGKWKLQNLERLLRSFRKEKSQLASFHWQESDWESLMAGYQQAPAQSR